MLVSGTACLVLRLIPACSQARPHRCAWGALPRAQSLSTHTVERNVRLQSLYPVRLRGPRNWHTGLVLHAPSCVWCSIGLADCCSVCYSDRALELCVKQQCLAWQTLIYANWKECNICPVCPWQTKLSGQGLLGQVCSGVFHTQLQECS